MGQVLMLWRQIPTMPLMVLMPVCALAFLNLPQYADGASRVSTVLDTIDNSAIRTQMTVPVALSFMLPAGMKGLFCAVMIFFLITTQDTYMHSWGSIFIQDVILPLRKRPFAPEQHVRLLRWSITFVAVFSFFFGIFFRQTEYIFMFMAITGAIIGGSGAVIIGGLYWKHGTNAAAWTAMTIGWAMSLGRIGLQQAAPLFDGVAPRGVLLRWMDAVNAVNSQVVWFWIMLACIFGYVFVALATSRKPYDMERLLHRGRYAVGEDHVKAEGARESIWWRITGITGEFSRTDRWAAVAAVVWNFGWFAAFVIGTLYNLTHEVSSAAWATFWKVWIWMQIGVGLPAAIWLTLGSLGDLKRFFSRLAGEQRDISDDGRVVRLQEDKGEALATNRQPLNYEEE